AVFSLNNQQVSRQKNLPMPVPAPFSSLLAGLCVHGLQDSFVQSVNVAVVKNRRSELGSHVAIAPELHKRLAGAVHEQHGTAGSITGGDKNLARSANIGQRLRAICALAIAPGEAPEDFSRGRIVPSDAHSIEEKNLPHAGQIG